MSGDKAAMEKIIDIFRDEIICLSKYVKTSKEDVIQELYAELISIILNR
ncbi:MAG: helix-turn-helix domain-containing protein [Bacillota bacterium]|nr:helix-turn-helix domain-containing protein [Bacillota bacterium]